MYINYGFVAFNSPLIQGRLGY